MDHLLLWTSRAAGVSGVLLCVVAVVARFNGRYLLGGFQVGTLLQAGIAAMIAGCLGFLVVLTEQSNSGR